LISALSEKHLLYDGGLLAPAAKIVPRRTPSTSRTTAVRPPTKRTAPTEETPTLPLTPIEVDALVRGASAEVVVTAEASTLPTVEAVRLALGSEALRTAVASPRIKLPVAPAEAPSMSAGEALPGQGAPPASGGEARSERGTRRPRETLRTEAIRPPSRKR
jgi:hypothetical protein